MKLLDRYIARQFATNIALLLVILFCFVIVIDVSLNLQRMGGVAARMSAEAGRADSGFRRAILVVYLVADLWWPRLLQLFNYVSGIVLLGAMGFTCAQLVRHRELTAVLTSGQSLTRVARPIFVVAAAVLTVQAANQEFVVPRIAYLLTRDHGDAGRRLLGSARVPPTPDGQGRIFLADAFDADAGVLVRPYIIERDEAGLATRRVEADRAEWRDGAWVLDRPRALGDPAAAAEPPPTRIETTLNPERLRMRRYANYTQHLSSRQIASMLGQLRTEATRAGETRDTIARLERTRFGRLSGLLTNLLALAVALPFFLRREPGNMVGQALKCAPLGLAALVGGVLSTSLTIPGFPPQVSVFLPAMVLAPLAVAMLSRIRT